MHSTFKILVFVSVSFSSAAWAQQHTKSNDLGRVMVLGEGQESTLYENVQNVTTLTGDKLVKVRGTSLGETLKNEVGVTASGYGPSASRPVIRGLDGDRIRILQNGLGVLDASGASQDHAVPIDPLLMDSVEIVRGPLSLLYGSSALGGVVNVITNRTHSQFDEGFAGAVDSQWGSVDNGKSVGFKTDYGVNKWMFHADGNFRDTQDLKIKGYARSSRLRQRDPLPTDQEARDQQPNSANQTRSGGVGTTYVGERGLLGVSASTYSSDYGVLVEPHTKIAMEQSRFDLVGEYRDVGFLKAIRLKSAQSIYKHREVESGVTGTTFKNNGNETRLEFVQKTFGAYNGLFGLQSNIFDFSALGEEAFLPETKNSAQALFTFQEVQWGHNKFNFGARAESNRVQPLADTKFNMNDQKSFMLGSAAIGHLYAFTEHLSLSSQLSYNERAPNYQELFARGAHVATFTYQVGDENLKKEKATALEFSLRHKTDTVSTVVSVFGQRFHDFITLAPTGQIDDTDGSGTAGDSAEDLAIYNYVAQEAKIYGAELETRWKPTIEALKGTTEFYVKGDYLRGKNATTGFNLPRMTPPRATLGVEHNWNDLTGDFEVQHVFAQTKTAPNELATDGFNLVNLGMMYKYNIGNRQVSFFARVNNLLNVENRNHVSLLKDVAQMGGRNFSLGVRAYF